MPVVVESFGQVVRGWAADDFDHGDRLRICVLADGDKVAEVTADQPRPDLAAAGIGDASGYYGYTIELETDTFVAMSAAITVTIEASGARGHGVLDVTWLDQAKRDIVSVRAPLAGGLRIFGDSFVRDNIVQFGATPTGVPLDAACSYFSFKMQAFMSGAWSDTFGFSRPSAMPWLSRLGPLTLERIRSGSLRLLFDMSNEGMTFEHALPAVAALHRELGELGLRPCQCAVITQNLVFGDAYRIWAEREGIHDLIAFHCYDYFPRRFVGLRATTTSDAEMENAVARFRQTIEFPRTRRFLSFNFTPRDHRVCMVAWMLGMRYEDRAYISFKGFDTVKMNATGYVPYWFPEERYVAEGLARLRSMGSLTLDLGNRAAGYVPEFDSGEARFFDDSFFSVVSETEMMGSSMRRITEKILKPMASFHPFVLFGNAFSLHRLRTLGFRTFHPYIDEDYDLWDEPRKRAHFAMEQINRLVDMQWEELREWYRGLGEILEHNYRHLHRNLDVHYSEVVEHRLLAHLAAPLGCAGEQQMHDVGDGTCRFARPS